MAVALRGRPKRGRVLPEGISPYSVFEWRTGFPKVPDIIEFVTSDRYLNRPNLYPRQATILKTMFLQEDIFTQYDYDVLEEWAQSFEDTRNNGVQPDVLERMAICRAEGRKWFRETIAVIGRRGSKGYMGGLAGAYVLWNYMAKGDPQGHYGVARDKRLSALVFAGKKEQAKANQWKDIFNVVTGAPCFTPYISTMLGESLTIYAPHDFERMMDMEERGLATDVDMATFEILPKESTALAGRGPAAFAQFYDEMAWVVNSGANRSAEEVYESATPALDQFGVDGFIYEPSSPWQKTGKFFENYEASQGRTEIRDRDGHVIRTEPTRPEMLMFQLASWDTYEDFERTGSQGLHMKPGGRRFCHIEKPMQAYDDQMRRLEASNPETFKVERRSHFAAVVDAYLNPDRIAEMWVEGLGMSTGGVLALTYKAHGDPSKSGANFGFAVAHVERHPGSEFPHVYFDFITHWEPGDFPDNNNEIDYAEIERQIKGVIKAFVPSEVTFDQFNSVATIQNLRRYVREQNFPKRIEVFERTATRPENWKIAETFKTALGLHLIHAPYYEQADQELTFLQDTGGRVDHPTAGPVQTKDVADAMMVVTYALIGEEMAAFLGQEFSSLPLGASQPGGSQPFPSMSGESMAHEALSGFARARRPAAGYPPASGRREVVPRRPRRRGWGG